VARYNYNEKSTDHPSVFFCVEKGIFSLFLSFKFVIITYDKERKSQKLKLKNIKQRKIHIFTIIFEMRLSSKENIFFAYFFYYLLSGILLKSTILSKQAFLAWIKNG